MPPDRPRNQCDGCRQELPLRDGLHYKFGYAYMACEADKYGVGAPIKLLVLAHLETLKPQERVDFMRACMKGYCRHCGRDDCAGQCENDE